VQGATVRGEGVNMKFGRVWRIGVCIAEHIREEFALSNYTPPPIQRTVRDSARQCRRCDYKNIKCRSDWRGRQHRRLPRAANILAPPLDSWRHCLWQLSLLTYSNTSRICCVMVLGMMACCVTDGPLGGCSEHTVCVNSLPKTVTQQRRDCHLNPGPSAPESSTHANHSATQPP